LNSVGGLGPNGPAADGEVEDYAVTIGAPGPIASIIYNEDFNDGVANGLTVQTGTFAITGSPPDQAWVGARGGQNQNAIATIDLPLPLPTHFKVDATVTPTGGNGTTVWSNGFIIFDFVDAQNFKYAGVHEVINQMVIGQVVGGKKTQLTQVARNTLANENVPLTLDISGAVATLTSGAQTISRTFNAALNTRPVGVGALNAPATIFDDIRVTQLT
jgi:hypothetical protein